MANDPPRWRIHVDTGGTFTDCIAVDPRGRLLRCKVLSSGALRARLVAVDGEWLQLDGEFPRGDGFLDSFQIRSLQNGDAARIVAHRGERVQAPGHSLREGEAVELSAGEEAPILAARVVTDTPCAQILPPIEMRLATTRGTNALLERNFAPAALLVTRGFADVLRIGTQQRPALFAWPVVLPAPVIERCVEVNERIAASAEILRPLDEESTRESLRALRADGIVAIAISLLHATRNSAHELRLRELALEAGFEHISCSHELASEQGHHLRSVTASVDAVLRPVLHQYFDAVRAALAPGSTLEILSSAGGLLAADHFAPKDALLSGPAGGAMGAASVARRLEASPVLSFDMGGTSTDVSRIDGAPTLHFRHRVGDAELRAPAIAIETVAAGGGSICWIDRGLPQVGPQSAGAWPGPACYGAGGPMTITDVNLLLGRIQVQEFPLPLDADAARVRLAELQTDLQEPLGDEELLLGFLRIANERMADAIRRVSVREGYDPAEHALVAFGGAAAQHACELADELEISRIVIARDASLLSAHGLVHARRELLGERELLRPLDECVEQLSALVQALEAKTLADLAAQGVDAPEIARRWASLRYAGQDAALELPMQSPRDLRWDFEEAYARRFGHRPVGREIEVVALRVLAQGTARSLPPEESPTAAAELPSRKVHLDGAWHEIPTIARASIRPGRRLQGPARILEAHSVTILPSHWHARCAEDGSLWLECVGADGARGAEFRGEIQRELVRHRLVSVAMEMGEMLRRSAVSTNIKEREDFSCALLDKRGQLIVNAPHIPVHLGALGLCVRELKQRIEMLPGDSVLTNHPALGGSHLPDLTVVSPVHDRQGKAIGFVASRAHHAEIGGIVPGSMPARATRLVEEGVVIPPIHVARGGLSDLAEAEALLRDAPWPSRNVEDNLSDLNAMLAANRRGVEAMLALAESVGADELEQHIEHLHLRAADAVRERLRATPNGSREGAIEFDDQSRVQVRIEVLGERARFDFSGSSPQHAGNLNANLSIVRSAVLYVLRLWIGGELPFNEGLMDAIELLVPTGILNPDFEQPLEALPAVVGGNVETSQRMVEAMLQALELGAQSQGTMNNLSFGNEHFGYYETLGGGCGASEGHGGASAVHSHMTNTRITDVEILEHRFPVRLREFSVRAGSGGAGRWRGGDGLVREFEFLEPVTLSLLGQSRVVAPRGADGGADGLPARQLRIHADGREELLPWIAECALAAGDRLRVETPGAGGHGSIP